MALLDIGANHETRCIVALQQENELFKFMKSVSTKIPAYVYMEGEASELQLYFNSDILDAHSRSFLERIGAKLVGDVYVVKQKVERKDALGIMEHLISEPMVVCNAIYASEGWLVVDLRFHSSRYIQVSNILASYMHSTDRVKLVYLGRSPGLGAILDSLNKEVPLSIVVLEAPIRDAKVPESILNKDFDLVETENNLMEGDEFRAILYKKDADGCLNAVSEDRIKNELLSDIRRRANEEMIIRYNMFVTRRNDHVRVIVIMPANQMDSYVKIIFSMSRKRGESVITLVTAAPFGFDVLDQFE